MINLLPLEKKQKLLSKKRTILIVIFFVLIFFFLSCLALMLFSITIYSQIDIESKKILFSAKEKELNKSEIINLQEEIGETNLGLKKINSFYDREIYISETLEKISQILPEEVYLTNFSAKYYFKEVVVQLKEKKDNKEEKFGVEFSLSGLALNREILILFKQRIEKEEDFTEVYFPLENLLEQKDIDFTITFKVEQ
jgi:Tfp pilus assembly protein PilN